jgi:type I restriction-modification system DNA methylase subunit
MSVYKTYSCGICKSNPDQLSHHKSHLETQKHKDKKELFELKLQMLSQDELNEKYKTTNINDIIIETETKLYLHNEDNNKKLTDEVENEELTQDEIDILKYTMSEQTNSISNKEALKDKIHEIHNYLRNNGAGYGMNALKVFNILYGLKKIEENGLLDKVKLVRPTCEFSYLLKLANENKGEILAEMIRKDVLDSIHRSELKNILFYEIPEKIKGSVYIFLVKEIDKITKIEKSCNVLLSGKIYEYFIGRDESAISELGAYFTDRHIVDYILKKLDPKVNKDGSINSMIDMFGGSGGFTTGYINHMNDNNPNVINWDTEINKVYHYDMNEDVIKSAALELFCLTGVLPNMKNNLGYKNSFTDDFNDEKYKYPLTNPPYGGDKNCKSEALTKREKIKSFIKNELLTITDEGIRIRRQKQLKSHEALDKQDKKESEKTKVSLVGCSARIQRFAHKNSLKGNDKESCSLMLLMDILDVGGTAIGVLKEGVFFNTTYKELRKCLIENYNVREVISVPADQFENTSTKTSIIIFDNIDEKTTEVKFSDLIVGRYTEDKFCEYHGDIVITESKDDIKEITDVVVSVASKEDILTNGICSLNGKDYNKKEIICGEGYELVKLGDISEYINGITHNTTDSILNGKYPLFSSSLNVDNWLNTYDYNIPTMGIIINTINGNGKFNLHISNKFNRTLNTILFTTKNEILSYYIYSYLKSNISLLNNISNGSTKKKIGKSGLTNLKIPIPKSQEKINEWVDKISLPYNEKNEKQLKIKELETFVQNRIKEIGENEECDIVELGSICDFQNGITHNTTDSILNGKYPLFSSSLNVDNWLNTYDYNIPTMGIIINTINGNGKFNLHISNKFNRTSNTILFTTKNKILSYYIYSYYKSNISLLNNISNGSTKKKIGKSGLAKIKIPIPKNKELITDLESVFAEIEELQGDVRQAEELYKQLIQELSNEAIPPIAELTEDNIKKLNSDEKVNDTPSVKSNSSTKSTLSDLKKECKTLGIKGYSKKNKEELTKLIQEFNTT